MAWDLAELCPVALIIAASFWSTQISVEPLVLHTMFWSRSWEQCVSFFFRSRTPTTAVTNGFPFRNLSSQLQFVDLQCTQEIRGCGATLSLQPCAPEVPRVLGKYHFAQGAVSRISAAPLSSTPQNMSPAELLFICGRHQEADAENLLTLKVFAFGRRSLDRNRMRTGPRSKLFAFAYRQGRSQNMEKVDDKSPFRTQVVQMFKGWNCFLLYILCFFNLTIVYIYM